MRLVIQRVSHAKVTVDQKITGEIQQGFLVLVGFAKGDTKSECELFAEKMIHLRVFEDDAGKMNRSLVDINGSILAVSQFTLYADMQKGRRPSFIDAMPPEEANALYEDFCQMLRGKNIKVEKGIFGAHMEVELLNHGPVTLLLDSKDFKKI
jgi:D-tyrosyl-tRNA(Tyr) deacylase